MYCREFVVAQLGTMIARLALMTCQTRRDVDSLRTKMRWMEGYGPVDRPRDGFALELF